MRDPTAICELMLYLNGVIGAPPNRSGSPSVANAHSRASISPGCTSTRESSDEICMLSDFVSTACAPGPYVLMRRLRRSTAIQTIAKPDAVTAAHRAGRQGCESGWARRSIQRPTTVPASA